jgi:hypothetical protein
LDITNKLFTCFASYSGGILSTPINNLGRQFMKIIKSLILFASLFAIAGAAFFQLLVLLGNKLTFKQSYRHQVL